MNNYPILSTRIAEASIVSLRDRARQVGEIFGLDKLENTRFITAVSEIGRNAVQFAGGGTAAFSFKGPRDHSLPQSVVAVITDMGPGIADVAAVWEGHAHDNGRIPLGITGAKRMVDVLTIQSPATGGTVVTLEMYLPRTAPRLTPADLNLRTQELIGRKPKTPLQELEKQNSEMLATLQELRDNQIELKHADERKNQFLAMLAHELRNPLGTMSMNLEILRLYPALSPEKSARCHDSMTRQAQQMSKLIEDMIDVSRISQGKVELRRSPVEMNALVTAAVEMCSAALKERNHTVLLHRHDSDIWITADETRLKQVISNIVHNAARYSSKDGHINIHITTPGSAVEIAVADDGIGISHDMLRQIFEMFVQGESASVHSPGGLGIGLTLVKRIVEMHRGTVTASSDGIGKGSQFVVSLPLAVV